MSQPSSTTLSNKTPHHLPETANNSAEEIANAIAPKTYDSQGRPKPRQVWNIKTPTSVTEERIRAA
ncbi:hypothetical protein CYLTODRAFT_460191, partial [Cylindrobasidium torrendii FP15055 ss-10]